MVGVLEKSDTSQIHDEITHKTFEKLVSLFVFSSY